MEKPDFCYWELARRLPKGIFLTGMKVVDVGNLHCVLVLDRYRDKAEVSAETILQWVDLAALADYLEKCGQFDNGINVEICIKDGKMQERCTAPVWYVRVWERGSMETLSCGSGACAAVVAAVENGFCSKDVDITVQVKGGTLVVRYTDDGVLLTGNASLVYTGKMEY